MRNFEREYESMFQSHDACICLAIRKHVNAQFPLLRLSAASLSYSHIRIPSAAVWQCGCVQSAALFVVKIDKLEFQAQNISIIITLVKSIRHALRLHNGNF
jgi:hypothetical protein